MQEINQEVIKVVPLVQNGRKPLCISGPLEMFIIDINTVSELCTCHRQFLFVLRFYGPVNPMGSCRARSVY